MPNFTFEVQPMGSVKRKGSHKSFKGVAPEGSRNVPMLTISRKWWKKMGSPERFDVQLEWEN